MDPIVKLKAQIAEAKTALAGLVSDGTAFDAKLAEIQDLEAQLKRMEIAQKHAAASAAPKDGEQGQKSATVPAAAKGEDDDEGPKFKSFAEQLRSVAASVTNKGVHRDERLVRAPTGMESGNPTDGGFLIQTDFVGELLRPVYETGQILNRVRKLTISANSNGAKFYGVDESSRATGSRWGGVQMYWLGEGGAPTASKPKLKMVELDLKKLGGAWYMTDELMNDAALMAGIARQAFTEEMRFVLEDSLLRGDGVGKPLGILNSPAKIAVPKEVGQAAGTVVFENVLKMYKHMPARSIASSVWFINQELLTQLITMKMEIGTSGVPVYMPPNGISGQMYGTIFGRPVVPLEYASAPGTEGDIMFVDFGEYVMADKGGIKSDSSMHVRFLEDEQVFKITYRVHGVPTWYTALTPYKGSAGFKVSPFITLADRT